MTPSQTVRADELRDAPAGGGERPGQAALEAAAASGGIAGVTGQAALEGRDPDEAAREYAEQGAEGETGADPVPVTGMRTATARRRARTATDPDTVPADPPDAG